MDRSFMDHYFEMAYEDLHGDLLKENEDFKAAQDALRESFKQVLGSNPAELNHPMWQLHEKITNELYMVEYLLMKYAYLKGAEDRDRMLK